MFVLVNYKCDAPSCERTETLNRAQFVEDGWRDVGNGFVVCPDHGGIDVNTLIDAINAEFEKAALAAKGD